MKITITDDYCYVTEDCIAVQFSITIKGVPFNVGPDFELLFDKDDYEKLDNDFVKNYCCGGFYEALKYNCEVNGVDMDDFEKAFDEFAKNVVELAIRTYINSDFDWYDGNDEDEDDEDEDEVDPIRFNFDEVSYTADDKFLTVYITVIPEYTTDGGDTINELNAEQFIFHFNSYAKLADALFAPSCTLEKTIHFITDFMRICWEEGLEYDDFEYADGLFRGRIIDEIKGCYKDAIEIGCLSKWDTVSKWDVMFNSIKNNI